MANRLRTAAGLLSRTLQRVAGETVIYRRGTEAVELTAVIGASEYEGTDQFGVTVRLTARDFLIAAADLVLDGGLATPQAGDLIDVTFGDETQIWEVMPIAADGQCYSLEPQAVQLRVHTRRIEVA